MAVKPSSLEGIAVLNQAGTVYAFPVVNPDGTNTGGGGAASGVADKSAFVPGTTLEQPIGGIYQTTPDTLTNNQTAATGIDANRNLKVVGSIASGVADSGSPVKVGGVYNTTAPTLTTGQRGDVQLDVSANTKITLATLLAGEDLVNNVMKVEQRFSFASYSTAQTATTIKSGAGFLHTVTVLGGTAGAITVWDNTAGSGTTILPAFTPGNVTVPVTLTFDVNFSIGLTITTAAATVIQFSYR